MQYHDSFSSVGSIAPHRAAFPPRSAGKPYLSRENLRMQHRTTKDDPASKLQRLMDQAIVTDAIEQAIEASKTPQTSNKRSHAEFQETGASPATFGMLPKPAKPAKKNAFAAMMNARASQRDSLNAVANFEKSVEDFEQHLYGQNHEQKYGQMEQGQWGHYMSAILTQWLEKRILPHLNWGVHPQTKINALHVLIDMATGIAYTAASGSTISTYISDSDVPRLLIENMYKIVEKMSTAEMKQLTEEEGFIFKVKTLRQRPLLPLESDKWDDLDEVLRVVKHPGPVNFKWFYSAIEKSLDSDSYKRASGDATIKIIRNDIIPYVTRSMCFETKYNALNILADVGRLLKSGYIRHEDEKLVYGALFGAMSTIGALMDEEDVAKVVSELRVDIETSRPGWLNDFCLTMESFENYQNTIRSFPYFFDPQSNDRHTYRSQRERVELLMNLVSKKAPVSGVYGQKRLLVKLLFLRWSEPEFWGTCLPALNAVLTMFPDRSQPLQTKFILEEIDLTLELSSQFKDSYIRGDFRKSVSGCIESNLSRATQHSTRGTSVEVKLSALNLLVEIGLRIVEWCHNSRPPWQRHLFQDHIAEDSMMDSMMFILSSLRKLDWIKVMKYQKLLDNITELDERRSLIPESMEGLDAVLDIIRDPEHNVSKSSRRSKVVIDLSKEENVIDLTDD